MAHVSSYVGTDRHTPSCLSTKTSEAEGMGVLAQAPRSLAWDGSSSSSMRRGQHYSAKKDAITPVFSEGDVAELCTMDIWTIKSMIRPDTARISRHFDEMMARVKRRSSQRRQDPDVAIERCFTAFSGRQKKSLSIRQFARRLSILSMEWSGKFSDEEYLALAQEVSDEDVPDLVTLESFKRAANHGSASNAGDSRRTWTKDGAESTTRNAGHDNRGHGCHAEEAKFCDDLAGEGRSSAGIAGDRAGEGNADGAVAAKLQRAAFKARAMGLDVWKLIDVSIQETLEEIRRHEDDDTPTSEDVAALARLSPDMVYRFMSKLSVCILPSPPAPTSSFPSIPPFPPLSIGTGGLLRGSEDNVGGQDRQVDQQATNGHGSENRYFGVRPPIEQREENRDADAAPPLSPAGLVLADKSRRARGEDPTRTAAPASTSPSPSFLSARNAFEASTKGIYQPRCENIWSVAVCDRSLRALSRQTASVRCRTRFYNQELGRMQEAANSLISRAATLTMGSPIAAGDFFCSSGGGSSGQLRRPILGVDGVKHCPRPFSVEVEKWSGRDGGGGVGGGEGIWTEFGGRMTPKGGGRVRGNRSIRVDHSSFAFSRRSPVERADPSHPRVLFKPGPQSTPPVSSPSLAGGGQSKSPALRCPSPAPSGEGISGKIVSAGMNRRKNSGHGPDIVVGDRVARLLLAALDGVKANTGSPSVPARSPAGEVDQRRIAATPRGARFDPPSIRNGLAGLTTDHVDEMLLRVEAATPGTVSTWKLPDVRIDTLTTSGTDRLTPSSTFGRRLPAGAPDRRSQSKEPGDGWFDSRGRSKGLQPGGGKAVRTMEARNASTGGWAGRREREGGGEARRKRSIVTQQSIRSSITVATPLRKTPGSRNTRGKEQAQRTVSLGPGEEGDDTGHAFATTNPMYPEDKDGRAGRASAAARDLLYAAGHDGGDGSCDGDGDGDPGQAFSGRNPTYACPAEGADKLNRLQSPRRRSPPRRTASDTVSRTATSSRFSPSRLIGRSDSGGPRSYSPSRSMRRHHGGGREWYRKFEARVAAAPERRGRRPERGFQPLDERVYHEFLNSAKKGTNAGKKSRMRRFANRCY